MLRIEGHPVIAATLAHRIFRDLFVCRRINLSDDIFVLEVHVNPFGNRIVSRIAGLTLKVQSCDNRIRVDVHHGQGARPFVGNVDLVKWRRIGDSVRLRLGWDFFDELHLVKINHANLIFQPIGGVGLLDVGSDFNSFDSRQVVKRLDQLVGLQINGVEQSRAEVS